MPEDAHANELANIKLTHALKVANANKLAIPEAWSRQKLFMLINWPTP